MSGSFTDLVIFIYICSSHAWDNILRLNLCRPFQSLQDVNISFVLLFVIFLHSRQLDTKYTQEFKCSIYSFEYYRTSNLSPARSSILLISSMEGEIAEGCNEIFKPTNQKILVTNFIISPDKDGTLKRDMKPS